MTVDFKSIKSFLMGSNNSRPRKSNLRGCWKFRAEINDSPTLPRTKRPKSLPKLRLEPSRSRAGTQKSNNSPCSPWDEIPTPSVSDTRESIELPNGQPPTQEKLMQIISCFPFPATRPTSGSYTDSSDLQATVPQCCPESEAAAAYAYMPVAGMESKTCFTSAFGKLVKVSVETMAITALPMDVWLKERLKKWVQLSGHEGSIVPASCKTLYKKQEGSNCSEARAYEVISRDVELDGFTPKYYQQLQKNEESFIEIEDLLQQFSDPSKVSIMDIKIGARTFLESEVSNTKRRADLYQKMIAIDPTEPTAEENERGEITKLRYMQFRERESSSAQLGFRIEAAKMPGGCLQKNFKKVRTPDDVACTLIDFLGTERDRVREALLRRITKMREAIERSQFFRTHEVVGSSILIVHDNEKVGCWMIDFAKSHPVMDGREMDHRTPWIPGNHEDGYLMGIDNLVQILEDLPPMGSLPDELPVR